MIAVVAVLEIVAALLRLSGSVGGVLPAASGTIESVEWLRADGNYNPPPRCVVLASRAWSCIGVEPADAGVVLIYADGVLWSAVVEGRVARDLTRSKWGRLFMVSAASAHRAPARAVIQAPVPPSASRARSIRLSTAPVPNARSVLVAADAIWITGESVPAGAWIQIAADASGPAYVSLKDVAAGPASVPVNVSLGETRVISARVLGGGRPAAQSLVSVFRLIDPPPAAKDDPQARRVLVAEKTTNEEGLFQLAGLGDADYELVAWHSQFGRAMIPIARADREVVVHLHSAGIARGRVIVDGRPVPGVDVISLPDVVTFSAAVDMIDVKGGDTRTNADGRFTVMVASSGGGELRIGGGRHPVRRIPLPRSVVPIFDAGDVDLGRAIPITVVLDHDPGCELRAAGPVGRTGLHVVTGQRTGSAAFDVVIPEPGFWEFTLTCRGREVALHPSMAHIDLAQSGKEVRMVVR